MIDRLLRPTLVVLVSALLAAAAGCGRRSESTPQSDADRHLARGDEYLAAGNFDDAEGEYKLAMRELSDDPKVLSRLGKLAFRQGRIVSGYFLMQGSIKAFPEDMDLLLAYGLASHALARTADARSAAKQVFGAMPANEEVLILLAETCLTTRDNQETRRMIQEAMGRQAATAAHHVALSILHLALQEEADAEREARRAIELNPQSAAAHSQLANLLLHRKDRAGAAEALKRAATLSPPRAPRRIKYIDFLVRDGAFDEARREIAAILEPAPDYVPARLALMKLDFQQGRLDDSLAAAKLVLERDRANYDALMQQAAIKLIRNDLDGVIADLKTTEQFYGRTAEVKYQLALAHLEKNELAVAEGYLQQALRLAPNYEAAVLQLADIQVLKGDYLSAITSLTAFLKRQPQEARAYLILAQAHHQNGEPAAAMAVLEALAAAFPGNPIATYQIGINLAGSGRKVEARRAFERALAIKNDFWPALEMLITLDEADNDLAAAARRVEAAVVAKPGVVEPLLLRGKVRILAGDHAAAEADLLRAVEINPKAQLAYLLLARLYVGTDRRAAGLERLRTLAEQRPSAVVFLQIGMLHRAAGNVAEARAAYEKALSLDARFSPALNNLAMLLADLPDQLDKALELAKRASELAPGEPVVADTYGWILYRQRQFDAALRFLQAAAAKAPADPDIQYHLAMVQYSLGLDDAAQQSFRQVLAAGTRATHGRDAARRLDILAINPASADAAARELLEKAVQEDPADLAALVRLAALEARTGSPAAAAGHYEAALKVNPRALPVMIALADLCFGPAGNAERGRELARQVGTIAPGDNHVAWRLGRVLYRAGEFAWAAALLQEAAGALSGNAEFNLDLARIQYAVGRVADAEATLKRVAAGKPADAVRQAAARFATLVAAAGRPTPDAAALALARQTLATEPQDVPALFLVGLQQEQDRDYEAARQTYEKILSLHSQFAPAMRQLATLYGEQFGDDRKTEELAVAALKALPDDPELNYQLGSVNYRRSDYPAAIRLLQQSVAKRPNHAAAHFFLGLSHYQLKATGEARNALQRALQLNLPPQETSEANRVLSQLGRSGGSGPNRPRP